MKEFIHLFDKIDHNRLPLEVTGGFIVISEIKNTGLNYDVKVTLLEVVNGTIYYPNSWGADVKHTHWLDLSKLTTKERAEELSEKAYEEGNKYGAGCDANIFKIFINHNKHIL